MRKTNKILSLILLTSITLNLFAPKILLSADVKHTFADALKCNSALYCSFTSLITIKIMNIFFAQEMAIPLTEKDTEPLPVSSKKEASNHTDSITAGDNHTIKRLSVSRLHNSLSPAHATEYFAIEYNKLILFQFWLYVYCMVMLSMFFLLPRGSIDSYAIMTPFRV